MGYVRCEEGASDAWLMGGRYEIEVSGVKYAVEVSLRPLYDPGMNKIKC